MPRTRLALLTSLVLLFAACPGLAAPPDRTRPDPGLREKPLGIHAFTGATLVVAPGRTLEDATLVVRDGLVVSAGKDVAIPAGARVHDLSGKTVYPGFVDAYGEVDAGSPPDGGAPHWNPYVTPQLSVAKTYEHEAKQNEKLRSQGFVARLAAPDDGILKGTSAVVLLADRKGDADVLRADTALHARLTISRGNRKQYPNSPMGAVALARQAMYDAKWYARAWQAVREGDNLPRPERNDALEVLQHYPGDGRLLVIDAPDEQYFLRADRFAREFGLRMIARGSGHEYRRLDAIRATGRPVIVPLDFPKPPDVTTPEAALDVTLGRLMHWDLAPENPGRLARAGVTIALTAHGLDDPKTFLKRLRTAVERGLSKEAALRALTETPADMFGVRDRLGSLEPGKSASFVVTDGDLFAKETEVLQTWVGGKRFVVNEEPPLDARGRWQGEFAKGDDDAARAFALDVTGTPEKPAGTVRVQDAETKLEKVALEQTRWSATFDGQPFDVEGVVRISGVVSSNDDDRPIAMTGHVVWPDETRTEFTAQRTGDVEEDEEAADDDEEAAGEPDSATAEVNFPLGAFGRTAPPQQPKRVAFTNATIWTCSEAGVLENATLLVEDGRVKAVGRDVAVPEGTVVVDCDGKHLAPGIIDCHSHFATDGGINESTQTITAEVRIGDFVDATDVNVYRQLAGGVTSSNILHGSANTIGGQNQVVKLRWGALPEEMKFDQAPAGVKFALGENVKQSNWGDDYRTRYPQTRMGVEQIVRDAFQAAKEYRLKWNAWKRTKAGIPPRYDLELEAIAEILEGERWIHCHSYRQDEILALIRTLDDYSVRIGTFQHVLEGYKVAEAMARHGAMGSAFSDWWAYKFEVYDAIPFNGALMHEEGVVVSFNSDDAELARHLNQEAAKAVKYGGVSPEEALKFVTLNPARQLRIDRWVGSLEPGKHADVVVWSAPPLSNFAVAEQTWIDGRKFFDRENDRQLRERDRKLRAALVQKVLASGEEPAKPGEEKPMLRHLWPRYDEFCGASGNGMQQQR